MNAPLILLAMLDESGHLNPTYKLARGLSRRGYDVRYLAIDDLAAPIERAGFAVVRHAPDLFPPGFVARERARGTLDKRRAITGRYRALVERLLATEPAALAGRRPDLMLIDVTRTELALWARHVGVPFAYLNTSLPQTEEAGIAPLRSALPFGADRVGRARAALAFKRFVAQRELSARLAAPLGMAPPYALAAQLAGRFGVARDALDTHTVYMPQLAGVPELVLCPEAFDFPRAARPGRSYVESIDLARSEPPLPPLPSDKPLIYAALGSQIYRPRDVPAFFARLVEAFRPHPALHLLLAVGKHVAPGSLAAPPNVTVVESAPQLAALGRARAMVTHGGLGSVKECIMNAVPMLGVPLAVDQPGNVARLVHHGLGLAADVRTDSAAALFDKLSRLHREPAFRARAAAMQASFHASEEGERGVARVEGLLADAAAR